MAREHDYQSGDTIRGDGAEYIVQAVLGAGGMGAVYLVKDKNIGRLFVLKVLHRWLAHRRDLIDRFEAEARALGHLSHPGIIEIFQLNRTRDDKQMPYYLMEVLTGESLADSLRRHGKLDLFTALGIATKLLHALDHAHERGIIHRDIKPDNVFLHRGPSSEPVVKLLDFGILKLVASEENPGIFIGTPRYCAPEQLRAGPSIGPKADLYSVGVVLFQMLTGHLPFEGYSGSLEEMVRTLDVDAPALTKHGKYPPELVSLVASALAKDAEARPTDAFTFASELRKIRRDFAPDREDPHTHVTAEVIAEAGRPQRDASQITIAHLAAPTSPDVDLAKLMDALRVERAGAAATEAAVGSGAAPPVTGFESTAAEPVLSPRDAVTALPRSGSHEVSAGSHEVSAGSVRYLTKESAAVDASRGNSSGQRTVPMTPSRQVRHETVPMGGRLVRPLDAAPASDARTPEPQAIDARGPRARETGGERLLTRVARGIERVVPLWALPVALAVGIVALIAGMRVLGARGVDVAAPASAPASAPYAHVPAASGAVPPAAPVVDAAGTDASASPVPSASPVAGASASASPVASASASAKPVRAGVARSGATASTSVAAPPKKPSIKPSDIGFE